MKPKYVTGDRVKCLATRFDQPGGEDAQGRKWSQLHMAKEKTKWVLGTIVRHLGGTRNFKGQYKVRYDGDKTQTNSAESHLEKCREEESDSGDSSGSDSDEAPPSGGSESEDDDRLVGAGGTAPEEERDPNAGMDGEGDPEADDGDASDEEGAAVAMGGTVEVNGNTWKRVVGMGDDPRGERPRVKMKMKKMRVNSHTKRSDFFKELFPVDFEHVLKVVKEGAARHNDKGKYTIDGLYSFLCCFYGGCQFSVGTDCWETATRGMLPPPNFGRFMSRDKFDRWLRYISEGPEDASNSDPWREVRWLVKGHNKNRKATVVPSWLVVVDETIWAWTGQGMPHLSFVKRKPEPLGAEVKNLCDGVSGVMLHLEIQEGKTRMAAKKYCQKYKATTACTVRLCDLGGLSEKNLREEDKVARMLVGDSWFASHETAVALREELGVHFVGNVKTATRGYPIQQLRWDLSHTSRGDHVVYKLEGEEEYAVGWNDHHFKTFVATGGTTSAGADAKRKRQTDEGRTFFKEVKRPKVLEDYYDGCGGIDMHNNFRQGHLRLEKFHKTKKWNARVVTSILSSTMVDAFRAWEHHFPSAAEGDVVTSRLKSFVVRAGGACDRRNKTRPTTDPHCHRARGT